MSASSVGPAGGSGELLRRPPRPQTGGVQESRENECIMVGENGIPATPDWYPPVAKFCSMIFGDDQCDCPVHHRLAMPALDGRGDN
jgi:hypothetical protein